jgi:radical SAM protein with 4Fe4S-binding SPASM domain
MKWNIGWGLSSVCNMFCEFCYSKEVRIQNNSLELTDWERFVDENYSLINSINYGTGESSILPDWYKLISYISEKYPDIVQSLTTNGYISAKINSNEECYYQFINSIAEVDVSLDFYNKERHNNFRGQKNAYDWAISTIKICNKKNIETTLVFIGTDETLTIKNLEGLFDLAFKYNIKLRMNIYRPTQQNDIVNKKYIASYKSILKALEWINKYHNILSIDDALFASILAKNPIIPTFSNSIRILHDGSITPSTYLISNVFRKSNISEKNILSKLTVDKLIKETMPYECKNCNYINTCKGGVYDRRYLWYNSFDKRDPYCPYREENYLPKFELIYRSNDNFKSVHHGYLPTMFFKY